MEENKDDKFFRIIITVIVIIILLLAIVIGVVYTVKTSNKETNNNIVQYIEKNEIGQEELNHIAELETVVDNKIIEDETDEITKRYSKIEVVWVDKNNNIILQPLKPILKGMTPVKYSDSKRDFVETTENDAEWYNYSDKKWANAMDNGSYFVWVPRFAYKITYYSNSEYTRVIGYCDSRGILKRNNDDSLTKIYDNSLGLTEVGNHYILAPAFDKDTSSGYKNGGWDANLSGFWVAKYETSMETNGKHTETENQEIGNVLTSDTIKAVSKPGVSSWRNISSGNSYLNAFNYNRELESHLIKSSEWGALAYLAYSIYGTDGNQIEPNKDNKCITGGDSRKTEIYIYNGNQSSTGNSTGVYDLSGGAYEFAAAYINNGYVGIKENGGTSENAFCENDRNTKYKTIYDHSSDDHGVDYDKIYSAKNYLLAKERRGDAIFESSDSGYGIDSWGSTSSYFMQQDSPFLTRGGDFANENGAGMFSFNSSSGRSDVGGSYRIVLACE